MTDRFGSWQRDAASRRALPAVFVAVALVGLGCGGVLWLAGAVGAAHVAWGLTTAVGLGPAVGWVVVSVRQRRPGVDVIAVLGLAGALIVGEYLAGAVITVMLASGRVLEAHASGRAARELHALLSRTPRVVHRYDGRTLTTPALEAVCSGDLLLVKPGEVVPVDGRLENGDAVLDESSLTGESLPVSRPVGDAVRSGVVNAGGPFDLRATTTAADSTYAGVIRLVEAAQADRAPFVRVADRYALLFLPLTLAIAAAAWAASGELVRAVAVLVVATPCPLILAAPIAIVSGMSRSARRGVIVKGGGALEQLARAEILLFDKTGTITRGQPTLAGMLLAPACAWSETEVLRMAASLDQVSPHVLASAIVRAALGRGLQLVLPKEVVEVPGHGVRGLVDGHVVAVGKSEWVARDAASAWVRSVRRRAELDGSITVFVGVDDMPAGAVLLDDPVRTDAARTIRGLRRSGIRRVVMVTGDRAEMAETVATVIGVDEVLAERTPAEKVDAVRLERRSGATIMVGDGINDAPALAAADVGVAVGARGSTASSEAADVVLTVDRLDRLGDALGIARRAFHIARQSVVVGIGLSLVAMVAAAFGLLAPTFGALLQEGIDVAVIFNALRVATGRPEQARLEGDDAELSRRFSNEHQRLGASLEGIRAAADALATESPAEALARVHSVHTFLEEELLPHEEAEDAELYPVLARVLGGEDPTGAMSRGHAEIAHLIHRLGRLLDDIPTEGPGPDDVQELRRVLYGLSAVLRLHFAQEDEGYFSMLDPDSRDAAPRRGTTPPTGVVS